MFAALSLGIRDYVHKCGFKSVIVGLSGGIDSALVAVLAAEALGPDKVLGVSMPARYSSEGSLSDAGALAKNLDIRYEVLPIEPAFQAVENQLAKVFAGTRPNEAEENIQSRLRGVTLMALSNKFGALVLTTGNKSEMAVGYCTLYGDMCGALAVIADVFKTDIYKLARWVNRERIIIPEASLTKPPSAELRPNQTDQDSLPPYETLDQILDAYVVKKLEQGGNHPAGIRRGGGQRRDQQGHIQRIQAPPGRARTESVAARVRHGPAHSHRAAVPAGAVKTNDHTHRLPCF